MINPAIFRAYDIRGKVGQDLNPDVAYQVGQAYGSYIGNLGGQCVYVGYDNRPSSRGLAKTLIKGLIASGSEVVEIGMVPTPVLYFSSTQHPGSYGAMVTGSHLPADSNGFKFCQGRRPLHGKTIAQIRDLIIGERFIHAQGSQTRSKDAVSAYIAHLLKRVAIQRKLQVIVDCQNGATSELAPHLLEQLGLSVHRLHCSPAAPYPFKNPDPQREANLEPLKERVLELNTDLGVAYDGDGDRLGVVDDRGRYVPADRLLALFAQDVLSQNPEAKVVYDILSTQVVADVVRQQGGRPICWKSGHALIKQKLQEEGALLAGEGSGHFFFADRYYGYDDGIYASCRLIELLGQHETSLSEMMEALPSTFMSPEERPSCPDGIKFRIVQEIAESFRQEGYTLETIDGARVQFAAGWGLIRASNTEAVLSLRFEARTQTDMQAYRKIVWGKLAEIGTRYDLDLQP